MTWRVDVIGNAATRFEAARPLLGHELLAEIGHSDPSSVMAMRVDHILRPLGWAIDSGSTVEFVDTSSFTGKEIYRNTLTFIMTIACRRMTDSDLFVRHSVNDSYYCELTSGDVTDEMVDAIRDEMHRMVASSMQIDMVTLPIESARRQLAHQGNTDCAELIEWNGIDPVNLSMCDGELAYFASPLAWNTRLVPTFVVERYGDGFLLRSPAMSEDGIGEIEPLTVDRNLIDVFNEYSEWLKVLGLSTMASLHERVASGRTLELIMVSEALHNMSLAKLAQRVVDSGARLVCLAGPSSSGKTTSSKRLAIQLRVLGRNPIAIELDDYYVDREKTPLDENGAYDFEAVEALDLPLLARDLESLLAGREVTLPKFDFLTGKRKVGRTIRLDADDMLIIEGIHGLNDAISSSVPRSDKFKIFICPLTGVNLDPYNRIGTTDTRLLRRIVRDSRRRGHSVQSTIDRWPSVIRGSNKHIYPFEHLADALFNTSLAYEISVLKNYAEPLLRSVKQDEPSYGEARRMLSLLSFAPPIPSENIPNTSIMREFIGGSCFDD